MNSNISTEQQMPKWAYFTLAGVAAAIGLASSAVTAKFFVLGLDRLEADPGARELLVATGLLMIVTELMAFGLASLLPTHQLKTIKRKLIVCGVLLLAFEAATIYITQVALTQTANAATTASQSRISDLRLTIDARRATAKSLRHNGEAQSASSNAWVRSLGVAALRESVNTEQQIEGLSAEYSKLEAAERPTMTTVLGEKTMLVYSVVRAILISAMGLVMFAVAGTLVRHAQHNTGVDRTTFGRIQMRATKDRTFMDRIKSRVAGFEMMNKHNQSKDKVQQEDAGTPVATIGLVKKGWCRQTQKTPIQGMGQLLLQKLVQ